jgi:YD repeat-containing protein
LRAAGLGRHITHHLYYDGPGNLTLATDQADNQVQYSYDAANQFASVIQLNSPNTGQNTTVYGYDGDGNPIAFEDANTHTTSQRRVARVPGSESSHQTQPGGWVPQPRFWAPGRSLT